MENDLHLLEAAIGTDRTVLSCDQEVRRLFHLYSREFEIEDLGWGNPLIEDEEVPQWLHRGAIPAKKRMLGNPGVVRAIRRQRDLRERGVRI